MIKVPARMLEVLKAFAELGKKAPACMAISLMTAGLLWMLASYQYVSAEDVESIRSEMRTEINDGFEKVTSRLNVSDAERTLDSVQGQIRQKEREVADLEMVLAQISQTATDTESRQVLKGRVFTLQQDISELKTKLNEGITDLQDARRQYNALLR